MVEQLAIEAVEEIAPQKKVPKIEKRTVKERRQQVLTVLTHLLHSERGMERMTTARLAQAVGVSEAALYRYFPSKTKMFEALLDNIEANLFSRIDQASTIEISTANRIRDILQMIYFTFPQGRFKKRISPCNRKTARIEAALSAVRHKLKHGD